MLKCYVANFMRDHRIIRAGYVCVMSSKKDEILRKRERLHFPYYFVKFQLNLHKRKCRIKKKE